MTLAKLDQMPLEKIIEKTHIDMNEDTLMLIWKKGEEFRKESSAYWQLSNTPGLVQSVLKNETNLRLFLFSHDNEINKLMFLAILYRGYMYSLQTDPNMTEEERNNTKEGIKGIRELFKGIDETIIFKNRGYTGGPIEDLTIIHTREIAEGKDKRENTNSERLKKLKKEIDFKSVIQFLLSRDLRMIAFDDTVGFQIQFMVAYNALLKEYGKDETERLMQNDPLESLMKNIGREKYIGFMIKALERHIEEINMDKLLLCLAYRYIQGREEGLLGRENIDEVVKTRLEIILRHIQKNPVINLGGESTYTKREFNKDMGRFIGEEGNITYLSKERIKELKNKILNSEITLNDITSQEFELIRFTTDELRQIAKNNPENYIFLLENGKCKESKQTILTNIISAGKCSIDLLRVLCEVLHINAEDALDLFDKGIISSPEALGIVNEKVGTIIADEVLIEKYKKYKSTLKQEDNDSKESEQEETEEQENARIELERYATAYRYTEILGKSPEEIENKSYALVEKIMGENINPLDVILLYEFNLIDIKFAIDLGEEEIKDALIARKTLRLKDAKYLREEWTSTETGKLSDEDIEKILIGLTYEQQIMFLAFVLGDDYKTINKVSQHLNIGYGTSMGQNPRKSEDNKEKRKSTNEGNAYSEDVIPQKMREPVAKLNLLLSFDHNSIPEEGIIDGHVIIHYPNMNRVVIEKLHKKGHDGVTRNENKAATYFMSEEEWEKYKEDIIKDGRVDRRFLIDNWGKDPKHWLAHLGNEYWENALLKLFNVEEDSRYSEDDKKRIKYLAQKSIDSKKMQSR